MAKGLHVASGMALIGPKRTLFVRRYSAFVVRETDAPHDPYRVVCLATRMYVQLRKSV